MHFADVGHSILLLRAGEVADSTDAESEFGSSEYAKEVLGSMWGYPPELDLEKEAALQKAVIEMIEKGVVNSAHDCADGGLATALAEKAFAGGVGARINLASGGLPVEFVLFGEDASRIVLSCDPERVLLIKEIAEKHGIHLDELGQTIPQRLEISIDDRVVVSALISDLNQAYESALEANLQADPELVAH
jgi:phosphoribosylformylglycinamidine synthase